MAEYIIQEETLTEIADAIRFLNNSAESIKTENMPELIKNGKVENKYPNLILGTFEVVNSFPVRYSDGYQGNVYGDEYYNALIQSTSVLGDSNGNIYLLIDYDTSRYRIVFDTNDSQLFCEQGLQVQFMGSSYSQSDLFKIIGANREIKAEIACWNTSGSGSSGQYLIGAIRVGHGDTDFSNPALFTQTDFIYPEN